MGTFITVETGHFCSTKFEPVITIRRARVPVIHTSDRAKYRYPWRRADKPAGYQKEVGEGETRREREGEKTRRGRKERFHLGTKQVTHAQSPYITVEACKLFNCLAYPSLHRPPSGDSLFPLHRFSFPPHLCLLSPPVLSFDRPTGAGPQIIEAQLKRGGRLGPHRFLLLLFSDIRSTTELGRFLLSHTRQAVFAYPFHFHHRLDLLLGFRIIPESPMGYGATLRKRRGRERHLTFTFGFFQLPNYLEFPARRIRPVFYGGWMEVGLLIPFCDSLFSLSFSLWLVDRIILDRMHR